MKERINNYRLIKKLAVGGMAELYLAVEEGIEGFERLVVLKKLHSHKMLNKEFITMFLDEARLVGKLNHPNIAQIYGLGKDEETFFLIMEYVKGVDLSKIIDNYQGNLPLRFSLPVVYGICEGLNYIHNLTDEYGSPLNIVHRDINPQNIILSSNGAVKIIDFGIAKAATHVYETRTGVIKGTYGYMAPEQITKKTPVGPYTDIFALGVILYELTVGKHPFNAPNEMTILKKILNNDYPRPKQINPNVPSYIEQIIENCLQANPVDRPANVKEIQKWMESFMIDNGIFYSMHYITHSFRKIEKYMSINSKVKRIKVKEVGNDKSITETHKNSTVIINKPIKDQNIQKSKIRILLNVIILLIILGLLTYVVTLYLSQYFI